MFDLSPEHISVLEILFWTTLGILFYTYAGFPLLLYLWGFLFRKKTAFQDGYEPTVSLIIPAFNEEDCIEKKINNALNLDYPKDKLEIIVASDASTDKTIEKVKPFGDKVTVFDFRERSGKMGTLNKVVPKAKGDILVLTDTNAQFAGYTIRQLVKYFSDKTIGCVGGAKVIRNPIADTQTDKGESTYWKYESLLKHGESLSGSCVGTDGSVYAVRKNLYPFPKDQKIVMDDFAVSLLIIKKGFRCVFEPSARAFEESSKRVRDEFKRKGRIFAGALSFLLGNPGVFFSSIWLKLFSHKILRWATFVFQLALFGVSMGLASEPFYRPIFGFQVIFYSSSILGWILISLSVKIMVFHVPYYFNMTTFAQLYGIWFFLKQGKNPAWEKLR